MMDFITHHAGSIGLIFFFLFFIGVLVSVYMPGTKEKFEIYKNIPFKDQDTTKEQL